MGEAAGEELLGGEIASEPNERVHTFCDLPDIGGRPSFAIRCLTVNLFLGIILADGIGSKRGEGERTGAFQPSVPRCPTLDTKSVECGPVGTRRESPKSAILKTSSSGWCSSLRPINTIKVS